MIRNLSFLLAMSCAMASFAEDELVTDYDYPSPDGRFAMRMTYPKNDGDADVKVDLAEKKTGKVLFDLGSVADSHLEDAIMVWSADSQRVAFGRRIDAPGTRVKEGEALAYFWNGATFDEVALPESLPSPDIRYPNGEPSYVKPYGGVVKPLRWLKSGELEISSDDMFFAPHDSKSYTGIVKFTIAFDAKHTPKVKTVGKSKTVVGK
jgi:hypothetical protein